jgi:hypothetical protein
MLDKIKLEIKKYFKNSSLSGILLYSGSVSRNEISIIDSCLVSDMELLYVFSKKDSFNEIKKSIKHLEVILKKKNAGIPKNFEIEIEGIDLKEFNLSKNKLPVHQFESIKNSDIIFDNLHNPILFSEIDVDKSSVYDILVHRMLNQLSLSFNFDKNNFNSVFYNRSWKNISDFLTYDYLLTYQINEKWICKKSERNILLSQSGKLDLLDFKNINLIKTDFLLDDSFDLWKKTFIYWIDDYNKKNYDISNSKVYDKTFFSKIYNFSIQSILKLFKKTPLLTRDLINVFENVLSESNSFNEFNNNIKIRLSTFGYSKRTYIYLNAYFFTYWLRHYKYYKSLK